MLFDLRGCLVARSDRLGTAKAPAAPAHAMRRMLLIHHIGDVCWLADRYQRSNVNIMC